MKIKSLGNANCVRFGNYADALKYLEALPEGYRGHLFRTDEGFGRWAVSYRYQGVRHA